MSTEKNSGRPTATTSTALLAATRWLPIVSVALIVALAPSAGFTQAPDDLKAVLRELESIRKELAELKALVQRQVPAPPAAPRVAALGATVTVAGAPFKGRADAPVTIVEFSDYQCPFCSRHVKQTMPELEKEYIQTGKVKYVFRNLPIESLHPLAFKAAEAAECANEQSKFWPMHDRLFENQQMLAPPQLPTHAAAAGADLGVFQKCLASGKFATRIRKDMSDASAVGITGTPGFLLGRTVAGSPTLKVESFISGARAFAGFKIEIDKLLGQ